MDEDNIQDDIRIYTERRWLRFSSGSYFPVYVLLAASYLLILIYFTIGLFKVFPCGPDTRQWEYFYGKCYYFSLETASWMQAKARCEEKLSQLVVINNTAEQNFIQTRTRNDRYWMGLTDRDREGTWRWVDGSDYNTGFMHWKPGEPNNDGHGEDCAHVWGNGEWNDVYCTYFCYYICEKPLPIRIKGHHNRALSVP
ncbi:hepatic lectin-like isoform X2 [Paroedura picta]|uniref:hepatic lectin-like isoform X2 n=1 Tax=Paroedura picta TaxID=143630 RepID=UPI004056EFC1